MTDDREARLPVWAQHELTRLRRNNADLKARIALGPEDSDTFAHPTAETPTPLGRGAQVQFGPAEHNFKVEYEDGELKIYTSSGRLLTLPESTNVVTHRISNHIQEHNYRAAVKNGDVAPAV